MSELTVSSLLSNWTRRVSGMYAKDLQALPEEAYDKSLGGAARSPRHFTAEVVTTTRLMMAAIKGEEPEADYEAAMAAQMEAIDTKEKAAEAVTSCCAALADALEGAESRMSSPITAPWGEEMTIGDLAHVVTTHIMYHDGQLTTVQMVHGDDRMHWMD